jgi:predicted TIM-barrel enzyme
MKGTSPSQVIRAPSGLRLTATECHDGEVVLFINSLVFRKGNLMNIVTVGIDLTKNDAADAAAICEAVTRPNMRFVPIKTLDQQGQLMVHCARQGFVEQRTATLNHIRGLLSELGIVLPLKADVVRRQAVQHLEELPGWANTVVGDLFSEIRHLHVLGGAQAR